MFSYLLKQTLSAKRPHDPYSWVGICDYLWPVGPGMKDWVSPPEWRIQPSVLETSNISFSATFTKDTLQFVTLEDDSYRNTMG